MTAGEVERGSVPPVRDARRWPLMVVVTLLAIVTTVSLVATDGNVIVAIAPVAAIGLLYLLWVLPLRYPALAILFLGLTLENPGDQPASGLWKSPLYPLGALLLGHINLTIPIKALFFSGVDLLLVILFTISFLRGLVGSPLDRRGFVQAAGPLRFYCGATILGAFFVETWGILRGGIDFGSSLWQIQRVIYLPTLFFLFQQSFRGPKDQVTIGKTIIAAACTRAMMAWGIRHFVHPNDILTMPCATTHTDSMLFAGAFCLCIVLFIEMPDRKKSIRLCAVVLPILVMGIIANNRRLAWVEIAISLLVLFFLKPMTRAKRKVIRRILMFAPVVAGYLAVGWHKESGLFKGAALVRSIVDSKSDGSTAWRDLENYDLFYTLKSSPLLGIGYGHPYIAKIVLPDVSADYALEPFVPHNSILGLWAYGGLIGFSLLWMMVVVGAFFASRAYKHATRPIDRVAALASTLMLVIYLAHCYGDLGLGTWAAVFLVSVTFAVVGKLAVSTGAWLPIPKVAPRRQAVPPVIVVAQAPQNQPNRLPRHEPYS